MSTRHIPPVVAASAIALALTAWTAPAYAQSDTAVEDQRAVVLYAQTGAFSPLAHLDDQSKVDFKTGFAVGGGGAYRASRHVAIRANFTFARAEARNAATVFSSIEGDKFNRYLYDADLQFRYPFDNGLAPYLFVGGGGITVQRDVKGEASHFTKGAGKVGAGLSYQIPDSDVAIFVEGTGWAYKWDRFGYDKVQFDSTFNAGISYRFRF